MKIRTQLYPKSCIAKHVKAALLGVSLTTAYTSLANAQDAEQQTENELQEIVVEGTRFNRTFSDRLGLSSVEIPATLNVLGREVLDKSGYNKPFRSLQTLPNVIINNNNPSALFIEALVRGFEATSVVNNRPENFIANPADDSAIEAIELLRGPASVSVGPVQPGGTINTVLKSPLEGTFLQSKLSLGSFDFRRAEIDANSGTLFGSETIKGRFTAAYQNAGTAQAPTEQDILTFRPVIEAALTENTKIQASYSYTRGDGKPGSRFPLLDDGSLPPNLTQETFLGLPIGKNKEENQGLEVVGEHDFLDNLKLTMRGQYQEIDFESRYTSGAYNYNDNGLDPLNPYAYVYGYAGDSAQDFKFFDTQLTGDVEVFGKKQNFVLGMSYQSFDLTGNTSVAQVIGIVDFNDLNNAALTIPDFDSQPFIADPALSTEFWSAYGELAIRPNSWLVVPFGVRYDNLTSETDGVTDQDTSNISVRTGATAELADWLSVYGSVAESFLPQSGELADGGFIEPETGLAFEVGARTNFADLGLKIDAAVFSIKRRNVALTDPNNDPFEDFVLAAGEQRNRGYELSLTLDRPSGFSVSTGYGYVDAETTEDADPLLEGLPLIQVPKHTANASVEYKFQDGALRGLAVGSNAIYRSKRYIFVSPENLLTISNFTLLDFSARYEASESVELQFNVLNVLNKRYLENAGFGSLSGGFIFGAPRSVLGTITIRF
jgi:iron complex outermembrane recepter protein